MLEVTDKVFSRTSVGPVGNFKAFLCPILNSGLVEFIVLGGDDDLWSGYSAIVRGKSHDDFWFGLR